MPYFRAVRNLKTPNYTNMKKLLLMATMLLLFGAVSAQIGDVQQKGNWLHSYDGNREVGRFAIGSSDQFLGFSSSIVVVRKGNWIYSYDQKGKELGRFGIGSSDQFRSVNGNNINIKKGNWVHTYDVNGRELSRRSL
jgi:hypothetical protein